MDLENRVALVTGASGRGMGRSIALTLAREGADIVVNYHKKGDRAQDVAAAIESFGRRAFVHQADAADPNAMREMVRSAETAMGPVDIAVCSAGGSWKPQDFVDIEPDHWREVMAEEVDAAFGLIRATLPGMRERGWGRVVLIGGHHADDWTFGPPEAPFDYPLGKVARHWLARTLGPREREHGVTINAIAPGPMGYIELDDAVRLAKEGPGNEVTQQHVAELVAFLCSERGARTSGAVIPVLGTKEV
jgi:acetoacetyl-CoA reductase